MTLSRNELSFWTKELSFWTCFRIPQLPSCHSELVSESLNYRVVILNQRAVILNLFQNLSTTKLSFWTTELSFWTCFRISPNPFVIIYFLFWKTILCHIFTCCFHPIILLYAETSSAWLCETSSAWLCEFIQLYCRRCWNKFSMTLWVHSIALQMLVVNAFSLQTKTRWGHHNRN